MPPRAFTLIELLIVLAIITILAAIAVPNFLEAQTRARLARVKADMRAIATAIETYHTDHSHYPIPDNINGGPINFASPPTFFETKIPTPLTTPIAYFTGLVNDVYINLREPQETYFPYHYATRAYARRTLAVDGGEDEFDAFILSSFLRPIPAAQWYLLSHGPHGDHDAGPSTGALPGMPGHITGDGYYAYDATNGTVSNGDLTLFGPGVGFP